MIAGEVRGHRLKTVKGRKTRPTSDRVKEGLFNVLAPYIKDARVLDLYSGTGSLAVEALSRGALNAVLVDSDRESVRTIIENLKNTGFINKARVMRMKVSEAVKKLSHSGEKFDIILIDPPYGMRLAEKDALLVIEEGLAADGGIVVAESDTNESTDNTGSQLMPVMEKKYGRTVLTFYSPSSHGESGGL